jgi:hypothetical protein
MSEGQVAGRLDVPVVADLGRFAQELRQKVEQAAKGVAAKIGVTFDVQKAREDLRLTVEEVAAGVAAKIDVHFDAAQVRTALEKAVREAEAGVKAQASVEAKVDRSQLQTALKDAVDGAISGQKPVDVQARVNRDTVRKELAAALSAAEKDGASTVNIRLGGEGSEVEQIAITELRSALKRLQDEADKDPVKPKFDLGKLAGPGRIAGIGALVQPAIAVIGQAITGLTAEISAAAPAAGSLLALPGLLAGGVAGFATVKTMFSGVTKAVQAYAQEQTKMGNGTKLTKSQLATLQQQLGGVDKSVIQSAAAVFSLKKAWDQVKFGTQAAFFKQIQGEIEPLGRSLLPLFGENVKAIATEFGGAAKSALQFMQSGPFRQDFASIATSSNVVLRDMVVSLGNLAHAGENFLVATEPFTQRVAGWIKEGSQWLNQSIALGRETGTLAAFLGRAGDKTAQLGGFVKNLWDGLKGLGRAATDSGNSILGGLGDALHRFAIYTNSDWGQAKLKSFFDTARPGFREIVGLLGDLGKDLAHMSNDGGLAKMVSSLRTDLLPGLATFIDQLGRNGGPAIVGAVSSIVSLLTVLTSATHGLGLVLGVFANLATGIAAVVKWVPGLNQLIGVGLTLATVWKAMNLAGAGLDKIIGFSRASEGAANASRLGSALDKVTGQTGTLTRIQAVYAEGASRAGASAGRFSQGLSGISAVAGAAVGKVGGIGGAIKGLVGALGGPWGIAITGATALLSYFIGQQQSAAQAAAEHKQAIQDLAQALRDSNGVINDNVRAMVVLKFTQGQVGDTGKTLADIATAHGISVKDLTDAYLQGGDALTKYGTQLKQTGIADAQSAYIAGQLVYPELLKQGSAAEKAGNQLLGMAGDASEANKQNQQYADGMRQMADDGTSIYSRLTTAVKALADTTSDANSRTQALRTTIDLLTGKSTAYAEAQAQVGQAIVDVTQATNDNNDARAAYQKAHGKPQAAVPLDKSGNLDTTTQAGLDAYNRLNQLEQSAQQAAIAAADKAKANGASIADQAKAAADATDQARTKALAYAQSLGLDTQQAQQLANTFDLMPQTVATSIELTNAPEAVQQLAGIQAQLGDIGDKPKTITITTLSGQAEQALTTLGYHVQHMTTGDDAGKIHVTADTAEAQSRLSMVLAQLATLPKGATVNVQAVIAQASVQLNSIATKLTGLKKGATVTVDAPTETARAELVALGYKVQAIKDDPAHVQIIVPVDQTQAQVNAIRAAVESLNGTTVQMYANVIEGYVHSDHSYTSTTGSSYADGGIRFFANGSREDHSAQIAPAGAWRVWAEPETGGEAYIPLSPSKRGRSKAIAEDVVGRFGGQVAWFADGGTSNARSLYNAARSARSSPAGTPTSAALVGGDLTITTQAPTVRDGLSDALFELRRLKLGGI